MGVPEQDYAQVKQWCGYRAALSFGRPAAEDQVEIATTMAAYRANLGKLEAQIAVAELARRYPRLRLAPDQDFTFHPNISFRGPQFLKVRAHQ
jgi:hypothetical protein